MAEDLVVALSGEEIIIDFCAQIAERLRRDCNLRESDSYQGGYSAKASIRLEHYGMDTVTVEAEMPLKLSTGKPQDDPDDVIDMTVDVPVEAALDQVRERSQQPVPTLAMEDGQPVIKPRRYVRRTAAGGATGETL